jgi:hypothetical protein
MKSRLELLQQAALESTDLGWGLKADRKERSQEKNVHMSWMTRFVGWIPYTGYLLAEDTHDQRKQRETPESITSTRLLIGQDWSTINPFH